MKPLLNYCFYLVVFMVLITACGKDGDTGPKGDKGDQGEQGEPGTANVIYSDWLSFDATIWTSPSNFFGQNRRSYTIDETRISSEVLNEGTVAVFVRFIGTTNTVQPLPIQQAITQSKIQVLGYNIQLSKIILFYYNRDDILDPGAIGVGNSYRYVIIPGGTSASGKIAELDLSDYASVKDYYHIPD